MVAGSTISFLPCLLVLTYALSSLYCSAIRGEMFDLNPPVPRPMITIPRENIPIAAFGLTITGGIAEMIRITWPTKAKQMEY